MMDASRTLRVEDEDGVVRMDDLVRADGLVRMDQGMLSWMCRVLSAK